MDTNDMQHGFDWHHSGQPIDGMVASEKLDGCRAYWNGAQLWTRGGKVVNAPHWFTDALPAGVHLDGEIWAGRGNFTEARLTAQYGGKHFTRAIRYVAFDVPLALGTWAERIRFAETFHNSAVAPVEFQPVENEAQLLAVFNAIKAAGGEGLILRQRAIRYTAGRTFELLKIKHAEQFRAAILREAA